MTKKFSQIGLVRHSITPILTDNTQVSRQSHHLTNVAALVASNNYISLAVRAAILREPANLRDFISTISHIVNAVTYPHEVLHGVPGTLCLLRVVRH